MKLLVVFKPGAFHLDRQEFDDVLSIQYPDAELPVWTIKNAAETLCINHDIVAMVVESHG